VEEKSEQVPDNCFAYESSGKWQTDINCTLTMLNQNEIGCDCEEDIAQFIAIMSKPAEKVVDSEQNCSKCKLFRITDS